MSHEVHKNDVVVTADRKGTWHNINTIEVSKIETLEDTRLNWEVEKLPLAWCQNGQYQDVPGHYVNIRKDLNLPVGVVGSQYVIIQNSKVFNTVQEIFRGKAEIVTCGSLFNCRQIWFLAKLDAVKKVNGDIHETYLLASSSHDGSLKLQFQLTFVRVVCNNTLSFALRSTRDCFVIPHSEIQSIRIVQAAKFYQEVFEGIDKTQKVLEILAEKPCDVGTAYHWATGFIKATTTRSQNIARKIVQLFETGQGNKGQTRYDLLNGVTERFTHGQEEPETQDEKIKQFVSSTFDTGAAKKNSALQALVDDDDFAKTVEAGKKLNKVYCESDECAKSKALLQLSFN